MERLGLSIAGSVPAGGENGNRTITADSLLGLLSLGLMTGYEITND